MNANQMTLPKRQIKCVPFHFGSMSMFCQNLNISNILIIEVGEANTGFPSEDVTKTESLPAPSPGHIHFIFAFVGQILGFVVRELFNETPVYLRRNCWKLKIFWFLVFF